MYSTTLIQNAPLISSSTCRTVSWRPGSPRKFRSARDIVPNVNRISATLRDRGGLVVYIQNTIDATAKEAWSNWFSYMSGERRAAAMDEAFAPGSFGHALWPELDVAAGRP